LVFDVFGRAPTPLREDDLLVLADVGDRVDGHWIARQVAERPAKRRHDEPAEHQQTDQHEHDQLVVDEEAQETFPERCLVVVVARHQCW
jgi:hypothetical protein